ncbi:CatA-like O-acetyltransferase (plasmid) [Enterobacter hormaechei]|uniref:CatA-like O-acetyltransferase n=1 Tax=Enterobacter hormaechei TaxID=158836 RepID=UPI00399668A6
MIWDKFTFVTVFHEQTETFSSLWSEYHDDFRQFHTYIRKMWRVTVKRPIPKGLLRICFVSANPWVRSTVLDLNGPIWTSSPRFHHGQILYAKATRC